MDLPSQGAPGAVYGVCVGRWVRGFAGSRTYLVIFFQVLVKRGDGGEEDDGTGIIEEWDPGVSLAPRSPRASAQAG